MVKLALMTDHGLVPPVCEIMILEICPLSGK